MGGTHLRSEVMDGAQSIFESVESCTHELIDYIDGKMAEYPEISFIAISFAGQVDEGVILSSPNIAHTEKNIKKIVESRYGLRLEIDNDLNCAIRAEAFYWKSRNIAALYVGTGIGAAVIDQGRVVRGSRNSAFEIGHIPYKKTPLICGCGRSNCLELATSGSGISKWLNYYNSNQRSNLQELKNSIHENERSIATEFENGLLHAVGTLITLANPEILVLGGGIIVENPYLVPFLQENLQNYVLKTSFESVKIERSALENAPLEGAKLLEKQYE